MLILLGIYLFRVPVTKWLIVDYLPPGSSIQCLDFELDSTPGVTINEFCLQTPSFDLELNKARWVLDDWQNKASRVNIERLRVEHKKTAATPSSNDQGPALPEMTLPEGLPQLTIDSLLVQSYLLQQPVNLSLVQSSPRTFTLSGDINASFRYVDNSLQGELAWTPAQILEQSPVLQQQIAFLQPQLNWQDLVSTQIISQFSLTGDRLETAHRLALKPQFQLDTCPIDMTADGVVIVDISLASLETRIDLAQFAVLADWRNCQLLPAQLRDSNFTSGQLLVSQPVIFNQSGLSASSAGLWLPELQTSPVVMISNLVLDEDNNVTFDYAMAISASLSEQEFDELSLSGQIAISSKGELEKTAAGWELSSDFAQIRIDKLDSPWGSAEEISNSFSYQFSSDGSGKMTVSLSGQQKMTEVLGKSTDAAPVSIKTINTEWQADYSATEVWLLKLESSIPQIDLPQAKLVNISNSSEISIATDNKIQLAGQSVIEGLAYTDKKLGNLKLEHQVDIQLPAFEIDATHSLLLESGVNLQMTHSDTQFSLQLPQQPVKSLQKLVNQFIAKTQLVAGTISGELSGSFAEDNYQGKLNLTDTSLKYDDFHVIFLQLSESFTVNSAGLQLRAGKISIDEVNVGIPIQDVAMIIDVVDSVAKLESAVGEIIGGTFVVTDLWLDGRKQRASISVSGLDLADIVALQKQPGIQVTGEMSGDLPFQVGFDSGIINQGSLTSDGPGKLTIQNNPAFDSIKEQQQELSFLQNVEYQKLSSKVELASDGWLDLELSIAGRNPDKKQEVIFNYSHKENIFTLLRSLRITSSIQDSIEKRIEQRYSEKGK